MSTRERRGLVSSAIILLLLALLPLFSRDKRPVIEVTATVSEAPTHEEFLVPESVAVTAVEGRAPASFAKPVELEECHHEVAAAEQNGVEFPPALTEPENMDAMLATDKMRELYEDFENFVTMPDGRKLSKRSVNLEFEQQLHKTQADPTQATGI